MIVRRPLIAELRAHSGALGKGMASAAINGTGIEIGTTPGIAPAGDDLHARTGPELRTFLPYSSSTVVSTGSVRAERSGTFDLAAAP